MDKQAIFKRVAEVAAQSPAVRRKVGAIIVDSFGEELVSAYNHNNGQPCEDARQARLCDLHRRQPDRAAHV